MEEATLFSDQSIESIVGNVVSGQTSEQSVKRAQAVVRKALAESAVDLYGLLGGAFDPYDMLEDVYGGWGSYPFVPPPYYRLNMKRGEALAYYLDWNQLRFLRDRSRKLCAENCFAQSAVDNRQNYTVGEDGLIIRAITSVGHEHDCPLHLLKKVQRVLDLWQEANEMPDVEIEFVRSSDIDGEVFIRDFEQKNGLLLHRPVEPEHVRPPTGDAYGPHYSFGIQTDPDDVLSVEGFWVVERPLHDSMPSYVPAREMMHSKYNTARSAKRGLPLFFSCELLLRYALDLLRGVVTSANVRARYAVIKKFTGGVVKEAAQKMMSELNITTVTDPTTGSSTNVQRQPFGSIVGVGSNQSIEFPTADLDSTAFEVALHMVLRAVAARCNMPEWMLTATSSGSYSSALVSEAPSTKSFGRMQKSVMRKIGVNRAAGKESLAWRQVKAAVRARILPPETLRMVSLSCEGPSLVVRDKGTEAQLNQVYYTMRVKPRQIIQQELGIDPQKAEAMFAEDDRRALETDTRLQQATGASSIPNVPITHQSKSQQGQGQGRNPLPSNKEDTDGKPHDSRAKLPNDLENDKTSAGFTGIIVDKLGRQQRYFQGQHVKVKGVGGSTIGNRSATNPFQNIGGKQGYGAAPATKPFNARPKALNVGGPIQESRSIGGFDVDSQTSIDDFEKYLGVLNETADEDSGVGQGAGIGVWVNDGPPRLVIIDVMDWGDPDLAKQIGSFASAFCGDEKNVIWHNEQGVPSKSTGWVELKPKSKKVKESSKPISECDVEDLEGIPAEFMFMPDHPQPDHYSCGADAAYSVGFGCFGVGPDNLEAWKEALGTTEEYSTHPLKIAEYLSSLGLLVETRQNLTYDDLTNYWRRGMRVIIPCQDYGPERRGEGSKAKFQYGHYLTYIGGPVYGHMFFQDTSADNVLQGTDSDASPGKVMIEQERFLGLWHDQDKDANQFLRFGIAVGPKPVVEPTKPMVISEGLREYSTVQVNITDAGYPKSQGSTVPIVKAMAQEIAELDLAVDGRELNPHATIKYGLYTQDYKEVMATVHGKVYSLSLTLGKTKVFKNDNFDVVYIEVISKDLTDLNKLLSDSLQHEDTHPTYKPHITLAYVKPGLGEKYADSTAVSGAVLMFTDITFYDRQGQPTTIALSSGPSFA